MTGRGESHGPPRPPSRGLAAGEEDEGSAVAGPAHAAVDLIGRLIRESMGRSIAIWIKNKNLARFSGSRSCRHRDLISSRIPRDILQEFAPIGADAKGGLTAR